MSPNEYMLKRYHERRVLAITRLGGQCVVCKSTEDLEIDHIDRKTKSFNISTMWSVSMVRFLAELDKCQLLCKPHHDEKTKREVSVPHGGGLTGKRNCRCDLCRPLKNAYVAEHRRVFGRKGTVS